MKERFPHNRNPLTGMSVVSFGISEGNIIRKGKKKKKLTVATNGDREVARHSCPPPVIRG